MIRSMSRTRDAGIPSNRLRYTPADVSLPSLAPGTRLGPYEVVSPLGAGGMGEVYRARDPRLNRDVALKILPAEVAADLSRRQRFEIEARVVAALSHPNIVAVYDVGEGYTSASSSRASRCGAPGSDSGRRSTSRPRSPADWRRRTRPASCTAI